MRRLFALMLLAFLPLGCSKDNVTNGPVGITVAVGPIRMIVDLADTSRFTATVYGTSDRRVAWQVQDIQGGNSTYGTIDSTGKYTAPLAEPDLDSVRITAISRADITRTGSAWVILIDPAFVFVSTSGSDISGIGSFHNPYRTIKKAVAIAVSGQTIRIGPGVYDEAHGETFPYTIGSGITIEGAGMDSTHIIGPGTSHQKTDAAFIINGDVVGLEKCRISTDNGNGIAIWIRPGQLVGLANNHIGPNYVGIYASGSNLPRISIDHNRIIGDSIGIVTADSAEPIIRNCRIDSCEIYGIQILNTSRPDLGDTLSAGQDTVENCGGPSLHYLIYNASPDTIWAIGNKWPSPVLNFNDIYIWDNEESSGASGPVILQWPPLE